MSPPRSTLRSLLPLLLLGVYSCGNAPVQAGIRRASVAADGAQADGGSNHPSLSSDGRYMAFNTAATNLVPGSTAPGGVVVKDLHTGEVRRAGTAEDGTTPGYLGAFPYISISADGNLVAFESSANELVPGDTNFHDDVFVKDLRTGAIRRASVAVDGTQATGNSGGSPLCSLPALSADGRHVAFDSRAANLVSGDTNGFYDIFVKDMLTGEVRRANTSSSGEQTGNDLEVRGPVRTSISADGRYVAFASYANNLVPGDTDKSADVFVKDMQTGAIRLVSASDLSSGDPSLSADGGTVAFVTLNENRGWDLFVKRLPEGELHREAGQADGRRRSQPALSADGRYVVFLSEVDSPIPGVEDTLNAVFVKDLQTGDLRLVSADAGGAPGEKDSSSPAISADGRAIAFVSDAANLVPKDTNNAGDVFVADNPFLVTGPLLGDANLDAGVDVADAVLVLRFAVQISAPTDDQKVAGDVNRDNLLDVTDAVLILQHIVFDTPLEESA